MTILFSSEKKSYYKEKIILRGKKAVRKKIAARKKNLETRKQCLRQEKHCCGKKKILAAREKNPLLYQQKFSWHQKTYGRVIPTLRLQLTQVRSWLEHRSIPFPLRI